jgi:hypothetical protein
MTKIKVFQGTRPANAPRFCDSCADGVVMHGPALWAVKEIAWVLEADSKRQKIGFITAKE